MFGKNKTSEVEAIAPQIAPEGVVVIGDSAQVEPYARKIETLGHAVTIAACVATSEIQNASSIFASFDNKENFDVLSREVKKIRDERNDGTPSFIIAVSLERLLDFGAWLNAAAENDQLSGIRLLISDGADDNNELAEKLKPVFGPDIVKMPTMPEVLESAFKYFYTFSPELREATRLVGELAENNYSRLYLLGAPGTGKTSLAYYFWLKRNKGRFVVVNLTAESTTDKASMKSLLCGHVSGAFPGSGAREGALSFAQQGVCFLDESHGVSGVVMQVLMEVLDSGQFMPFGAVAKRELQCAVVFASNRSWDTLTKNINLDEHARIGATIIELADLAQRKEDLIAVVATTLNRLKKQFTTWQAPLGLTKSAWELYANSPWYGNTRALIRVTETAATNFAQEHSKDPTIGKLIDVRHVTPALAQWEPSSHESLKLYSSTSRQIND